MKKLSLLCMLALSAIVAFAEGECRIEWFTPEIVHVVKTAKADYKSSDLVVIAKPQDVKIKKQELKDKTIWSSGKLTVTLDKQSQCLTFMTPKGEVLIKESTENRISNTENRISNTENRKSTADNQQSWQLEADEAIYGLGILQNGKMSQRGENRELHPDNTEDGMPFFQSVKGYGIYWDNFSSTTVSDKDNILTFRAEVADAVDYYFIYGGNADGVVAGVRHLTGDVPMFPLWTYGFHQSRERYKTKEELVEVVETYRKQEIPLDGIIQDWQYWGSNYLWNAMEFTGEGFRYPERMISRVHDLNAHLSISIWQSFGPYTKAYRELEPKGLLFDMETWPQSGLSHIWPPRFDYPSGVRVYDAYSDEARDIYWKHLKRLYDLGIDAWWMDSTEPDHHRPQPADFEHETAMGPYKNVRCIFPLRCVSGVYEHQRAEKDGDSKRVFILTRSGFIGQQRYGCNVWSGDVGSSWENLRKQVPAGLNFCLTGNPNFNSDLGGFFAGSYNGKYNGKPAQQNPAYQELYVRWMQQGVFTPMMRSHGTEVPREIYLYGKPGEPVYDALTAAVKLRYRLLPYIYSTAWQTAKADSRSTMMRALVMDFRNDKNVHDMATEYMFGKAILATPILDARYTSESDKGKSQGNIVSFSEKTENSFYLPAGSKWYDFNTNELFDGGQNVKRTTSLQEIPFFVKAGAILPLGPDVQYSTEKPWDDLEIRIYPGANGMFTLYEDEFDNYNYEQGKFTEIAFSWNDKARTLTISPRRGTYEGMLQTRTFRLTTPDGKQKSVIYNGKALKVRL